jgi:hypothetical protein
VDEEVFRKLDDFLVRDELLQRPVVKPSCGSGKPQREDFQFQCRPTLFAEVLLPGSETNQPAASRAISVVIPGLTRNPVFQDDLDPGASPGNH